jgi:nucleoside-diphosphate-sugar epimerase
MKVLFIGGTGNISLAVTQLAAARGIEVTLVRRGQRAAEMPEGVSTIVADIVDEATVAAALGDRHFDAVVDWIAFTPDQIERDIRQYSRDKIACEERLMLAYRDEGFPITIVRPSLTYGNTQIVLAVNSWQKSFTAIDRMRRGEKVIVPGDGSSLWCITHNSDFAKGFVGLLGHRQAIGHAFHITSDEMMTWDQFYRITAEAAGVEARIVHIASDFLGACDPGEIGSLTGDKASSVVFDNSKIKRFVPDYCATLPFAEGIQRTIDWFDADPARRVIDHEANARWDTIINAYESGLAETQRRMRG